MMADVWCKNEIGNIGRGRKSVYISRDRSFKEWMGLVQGFVVVLVGVEHNRQEPLELRSNNNPHGSLFTLSSDFVVYSSGRHMKRLSRRDVYP